MNAQLSTAAASKPSPVSSSPDAVITIHSQKPKVKKGEKNGKPWEIREQEATIETPFMRNECRVSLGKNDEPYAVGRYRFDVVRSLKVSDFGSIQFARELKLERID